MTIILITLEKHRDGIWVTQLVDCFNTCDVSIQVHSIEAILHGPTDRILMQEWKGIINRVSDAADLALYKGVVAFLQAARVLGIPIWNGPDAYSLCGNKWCHHILFERAGLYSPSTFITFGNQTQPELSFFKDNEPMLVKPNAGGFGAGIHRVDSHSLEQSQIQSNDGITLFQNYIKTDRIYRVWFLKGRTQCGVVRKVTGEESDFSTGCTGQVCAKKNVPSEAFQIPKDLENDIQRLCKLVPDAHCGSIEFLYDQNGQRYYFDFNLLSTLPFPKTIQYADSIWGNGYDPWKEQANEIMNFFRRTNCTGNA